VKTSEQSVSAMPGAKSEPGSAPAQALFRVSASAVPRPVQAVGLLGLLSHRKKADGGAPGRGVIVSNGTLPSRANRSGVRQGLRGALSTQFDNTGPCLDALVFVEQAGDRLRQALNNMPERARQAFLLHRLEGLPPEKIARQLGVTAAVVERDVANVVQHLTRELFAGKA